MIAEAPAPAAQVAVRLAAEEPHPLETAASRGLVTRRSALARQPLPPVEDAAVAEELLSAVLSDEATARPRGRGRLASLLGGRHGR